MSATDEIKKFYRCEKCALQFNIPLRQDSDAGEYNACTRCKSIYIRPLFAIEGVGEFESEQEAYGAYFSMTED